MYLYHGLSLLKRMICVSEPECIARDLITRGDVHHRATRNADHHHAGHPFRVGQAPLQTFYCIRIQRSALRDAVPDS